MAVKGEVYRIFENEGSKDVEVINTSGGPDVIDFVVSEVENLDGVSVGDTGSVDLSSDATSYTKLYNADGEIAYAS